MVDLCCGRDGALLKALGLGSVAAQRSETGLVNMFASTLDVDKLGKNFSKVCLCVVIIWIHKLSADQNMIASGGSMPGRTL